MRGAGTVFVIGSLCLVPWSAATGQQYGPPDVRHVPGASAPLSAHDCTATGDNAVSNCSFESGDFTDWVTSDLSEPFFPLTVAGPTTVGTYGFFTSAPTQGAVSALHGFDGNGPGTIEIGQDVTVPAGGVLEFDYRGAWDLQQFGAELDRTFEVNVEPSGGGAPMQTELILTAEAGTLVTDTGSQSAMLDLAAFSGQSVRVNFVWTVPENFSGPAFFELDNVQLAGTVADLALTKAATIQGDGTTVVFDIEVTNAGPDDATGVVVTDPLPECTELQSDDCSGDAGPPWTWSVGDLASGASASCNVTVDASACAGEGAQTNAATVEGDQGDPTPDDNTAEAEFELETVPALPAVAAVFLAALLSIVALRTLRRVRA